MKMQCFGTAIGGIVCCWQVFLVSKMDLKLNSGHLEADFISQDKTHHLG